MNLRIPETPPRILPLIDDAPRPLFSVMIPSYNCFYYLRTTMESVLAQDPGPEKLQIEVIDDCSTDGDVEALVREVGKGRIDFFRQQTNRGSLRNFETCINRARGHWVHILHGDDKVAPGFYQEIETLFAQYTGAGAAFTRHALIDSEGLEFKQHAILSDQPGILPNWLYRIAQINQLQPPAIVIKRSVYEQLGSFFAVEFGEDWEMWVRIASRYPVAYSPKCLASYRVHTNNITSRNFLSGQNIRDLEKVLQIIKDYLPGDQCKLLHRKAKKKCARYIAYTAHILLRTYGDPKAARQQLKGALKMYPDSGTLYLAATFFVKNFLYYLNGKIPITKTKMNISKFAEEPV